MPPRPLLAVAVLALVGCWRSGVGLPDAGRAPQDLASSGDPSDAAAMRGDGATPPDLAEPLPTGPTQAYNFRIDAAHTGGQPRETLKPPLVRAWSVDVDAHATYALVAHGRVFAAGGGGGTFPTQGSLVAVDTESGAPLWGPLRLGSDLMIAYADGLLFVTVDKTRLLALDEATGETRWSVAKAWSDAGQPVAANGLIYLNTYGGPTAAYDQKTGARTWSASPGGPGSPAVADGVLYETSGCADTSAVDALTGELRWRYMTGCTGGGGGMATVYSGRVYVRDPNYGDVILGPGDGKVRGAFNSDTPLAFADGMGYSLLRGTLLAFAADSLVTRWSFRGDGKLVTSPLVAGAYVYVASSRGTVYALDGSGHVAWSDESGATVGNDAENLSLTAAEGTLLVPIENHIVAYREAPPTDDAGVGVPDLAPPPDLGAPPDLALPPDTTQAPSFRIDPAHTGAQAGERLTPPLELAWSYDAGDTITYPLVAGGRVFISTAGGLTTALDTRSGAVVWGPNGLGTGLLHAYDRGRLFGVDRNGLLVGIDAATGAQQWITQLSQLDYYSPPVAANGLVYVNGLESGGDTYAVDGASGRLVWDNHTFDGSDGAVAVAGGIVYEVEGCMQVTAWDAASGAQKWRAATSCSGGGGSAPAVYDGRVYARDLFRPNAIFDAATGAPLGTFVGALPPAFSHGLGYYLDGATLVAVPVAGNMPAWSFGGDGALVSAPVADGALVYVGSSLGNVYALDDAGRTQWVTSLATGINAKAEINSMAIAEGMLLVPAGNVLYAFRSSAAR